MEKVNTVAVCVSVNDGVVISPEEGAPHETKVIAGIVDILLFSIKPTTNQHSVVPSEPHEMTRGENDGN